MATKAIVGSFLIVSAWEPELRALRGQLASTPHIARRTRTGCVGVGLVEAAIGTEKLLAASKPPGAVVLVGTAGLYPGCDQALSIGGVAVARGIHLLCGAVTRKDAYFPAPMPTHIDTQPALRRAVCRAGSAPTADVACPLSITQTTAAARRAARATDCALENLEVFAVARVAVAAKIPFAAVLGISNLSGPGAHHEWKTFAGPAVAAAADAVFRWLQTVA